MRRGDVRSKATILPCDSPEAASPVFLTSVLASPVAIELAMLYLGAIESCNVMYSRRTTDAENARTAIGARHGVCRASRRAERRRNMLSTSMEKRSELFRAWRGDEDMQEASNDV